VETGGESAAIALRVMATSPLKEAPAAWLKALTGSLTADSKILRQQAVATARAVTLPKNVPAPLLAALAQIGRS
ncbi:MAG: hypothetical protein RJB55_1939, partial [Verrucomicrobiota bacterium]